MEGDAALYHLSTIPVEFVARVIHQEISTNPLGKSNHRRDHLDTRPDGIDEISSPIQVLPWMEDVIIVHGQGSLPVPGGNIRTDDRYPLGSDIPGGVVVTPYPNLDYLVVPGCDIMGYTLFNTFIGAHHRK